MILAQRTASKVPGSPSDGNFLQGHPTPAFSEKVQGGDQGKFFKIRPKGSPRFKGPSVEKILAKTAALKVPEMPSFGNF